MRKQLRQFGLFLLAQTLCVGLCLWIHSRYVVSSAEWSAAANARAELIELAKELQPKLKTLGDINRVSIRLDQRFSEDKDASWLLVDSDSRIIECSNSDNSANLRWSGGDTIEFRSSQDLTTVEDKRQTVIGQLITPFGPSPSVAFRLPESSTRLVLFSTQHALTPAPAMLVRSLPSAGIVTFLLTIGLLGVVSYLALTRFKDDPQTAQDSESTQQESLRRTQALLRTRDTIIFGLAKLAESRDTDTGQHLERISQYSTLLASAMRKTPKFRNDVTPAFVQLIGISSALHDIGKVGIEDAILLKPGRLTLDERKRIQQHTIIGSDCLTSMERRLGTSNFLQMANQIALSHHERWNGMGYPHGISSEQIPLAARIVAIADVYDALSIRRVYKEPWPHEKCVELIREESGQHFDPDIVAVFLDVETQFREIAERYADRISAPAVQKERESDSVMTKANAKDDQQKLDTVIATVQPAPEPEREPQQVS